MNKNYNHCLGLSVALFGSLLASGQSIAADMPVKAVAPAAAFVDWSGVYIGAHVGYGGGMTDWSFMSDFAASGFLGGGQIGINKQIGSFVFGLELDGSWADIKGSQFQKLGGPAIGFLANEVVSSKVDGLVTFAGRAGLAADRWFVFAKGGVTWVHEEHSLSVAQTNIAPPPATFSANFAGSETRLAPTVGFGAEYALAGNWSIKGEYDYVYVGTRSPPLNGTTAVNGVASSSTANPDIEQSIHVFKLGANYRFGGLGIHPGFAPVPPMGGTNWSGAYLGVQGAYGLGRETWADFVNPVVSGGGDGRYDVDGWLAGFSGGVNAQAGSLVFGVEGEWMWTGMKGSQTTSGVLPAGSNFTSALDTKIDWLAIASARVGFVVADKLLLYGKGGVAIAQEKHSLFQSNSDPLASITSSLSAKAIHTGGVIGVGAEYALGNNWSAKIEYDYIKMFAQSYTATGQVTVVSPGLSGTIDDSQTFSKMSQDLQLVKFGVNYHFAAQPNGVTARY